MPASRKEIEDILRKHESKIQSRIETTGIKKVNYSQEYLKFKQEMAPEISKYERWCKSVGSIIKLKISEKDKTEIKNTLKLHILILSHGSP